VNLNCEVLSDLKEIVAQVHQVSTVMSEIAAASEQQRIGQLHVAVAQLNHVTQQTAMEAACTAEALASLAVEVQHLVETFRLSQRQTVSMEQDAHHAPCAVAVPG
jgi:methyl-accepting chemotaxis protein